jgi:arylsulfatase A-like enzyme
MRSILTLFPGILNHHIPFLINKSARIMPNNNLKRPNIILVMADDLGWGDTGYNGNAILKTPYLDQMASVGTRFDRFYSAAPVCSPTRGSCLTGRHPYRYGIFWADVGYLPTEEITLAEALKTEGYSTGHFGKWHVGTLTNSDKDATRGSSDNPELYSPPWDNGFDTCFSTESWMPTYNPMVWGGGKWTPTVDETNFKWLMDRPVAEGETPDTADVDWWHGAYWEGPGKRVTQELVGDDSKIIMDRALKFIEAQVENDHSPFLALIWFHTPHTPLAAGDRHRAPYQDQPMEAQHWFGAVTAMDEQIGRLRKQLRAHDIADNTLLWFCSDNGPSYIHDFNSAGLFRGKKGTLFEGGVRVPAILEWPAMLPGPQTIDAPCVTSDFYPTILKVLDIALIDQPILDGIDIMPLLTGGLVERPFPIAFQSPMRGTLAGAADEKQMALCDNQFKLISLDNGQSFELYDLIADPSETHNIASKFPEIVKKMAKQLSIWQLSCAGSLQGKDYS